MQSKFLHLKEQVTCRRKEGASLKMLRDEFGIPLSTLSGWMRNVELSNTQKEQLKQNHKNALIKAREKAVLWHNAQKQQRVENAGKEARLVLSQINTDNKNIMEIALAFLYLGEGSKKGNLSLANSNPFILQFYLSALEHIYGIKRDLLRYDLHLRADQDSETLKNFWSESLNIPLSSIKYCAKDKRTEGKTTFPEYKGVCVVYYGNLAVQRRLIEISKIYSNMTIHRAISSFG